MNPGFTAKAVLVLEIVLLGFQTKFTQSFELEPEVDYLAEVFRYYNDIPGLAVSIINSSDPLEEVFAKGYGWSDQDALAPMKNDTRFLIASISKSFTAITTCRVLNDRFPQLGSSVLDVPIVQLAPSFNLTLIDRYRTEKATFRDLLSHKTCLNSYGIGVTAGAYQSRADRLYRYRYIKEKCPFRSRFEYSNAMFVLTGEIVSHLVGVPFENLVMDLFNEIGMVGSLIVTPDEDYETLEKMSRGYYYNLDKQLTKMKATVYNSHSGAASGGVISTASDMGKYVLFHLNKGRVDGKQIVPVEVMEWLYEPSNHVKFSGAKVSGSPDDALVSGDFGYGLGLDLGIFDGWVRIGHIGDLSPFTSRLSFYPDLGIGLFTVTNGPGPLPAQADHLSLHNSFTQLLRGNPTAKANIALVNATLKHSRNRVGKISKHFETVEKIDPNLLVGVYGHPYEGDVEISYNGTTLGLTYGIWGKGYLVETAVDNVFSTEWEGDIISIFLAYSGGPPLPDILWDFNTQDKLAYVDSDGVIMYKKNGTIDTYPEIPWDENSCGI